MKLTFAFQVKRIDTFLAFSWNGGGYIAETLMFASARSPNSFERARLTHERLLACHSLESLSLESDRSVDVLAIAVSGTPIGEFGSSDARACGKPSASVQRLFGLSVLLTSQAKPIRRLVVQ